MDAALMIDFLSATVRIAVPETLSVLAVFTQVLGAESLAEVLVSPALRRWNQPCFFGGSGEAANGGEGSSATAGGGSCCSATKSSGVSGSGAGGAGADSGVVVPRRKRPNRPRDLAGVSLTTHTWWRSARPATAGRRTR